MNNTLSTNSLSVSVRVYRTLLVAYPKKFREHYETQMVQVFRDSCREAFHYNGIPGVVDLWIHTFVDLVFTALNERISERSRYMFSPKVILWGGVASVFAGLFYMMTGLAPSSGGPTLELVLVLGLGGLVGLYSRQVKQGGRLGLGGFALGVIGTVAPFVASWWEALEAQSILVASLAFLTLGIGLALLGVASLRGKTLPRWQGLPLGLGLLHTILGIAMWLIIYVPVSHGQNPFHPWNLGNYGLVIVFALFVLVGIGWIGLGITLATDADAKIAQPPPAPE
jgi:hypothetical protein